MEKLEKHIKDKLEARQISPSPRAWEKIAAQTVQAPTKRGNRKLVYFIAAGFIGLLLTSIFFFRKDTPVQEIQLAEQDIQIDSGDAPKNDAVVLETEEQQVEVASDSVEGHAGSVGSNLEIPQMESITLADNDETPQTPIQDSFLEENNSLITEKINEVVAQVRLLESVNTEVSDAEVDSLLRAAQRDILSEQLFTPEGGVDAMALLTEVEDELDESFRDQIFDALKDGYFKLRTAVADRNN